MTRARYFAFLFASHLLSLGLAVYTTRTSGVPVAILLYAFLIDYGLRLGTIHFLHEAGSSRRQTWVHQIAPYISKLPARGQQSNPIHDGEAGPPAAISKYLIVLAALASFAFVLMNVDADQQIRLTFAATARDFWWALVIGIIYWANSLLTRTLVIQPAEAVTRNFGYNSKEVTILALAVLTGGAVVAARQNLDLDATGWAVMGPLLFFRFLFDLWASVNAIPDQPVLSGDSSMRASRSHGPS